MGSQRFNEVLRITMGTYTWQSQAHCPPNVVEAYSKQFRKYFLNFLRLRSREMRGRGRMLLTVTSRSSNDPTTKDHYKPKWDLLAESLFDLVVQRKVISKTRPILEDSIKDMLSNICPVTCIKIADLGCASGPNTFFPTYLIIDTITNICRQQHRESPELQVFLNDLPQNDFNTVFRSVPAFGSGPCFIAGVAGSFYERLFPSRSMHFIHSFCSLHWRSKVPGGIENNKGNIYMTKSSPSNVLEAYSGQFRKDFLNFLRLRSHEMISGGGMLLTLVGRNSNDPTTKVDYYRPKWDLLAKSLLDLVAQGVVPKSDVDSFNVPFYNPCKEELMEIVEMEEHFVLEKMEIFEVDWDFEDDDDCKENFMFDKSKSGQNVANFMRAISESMLANHFGETIMDDLFSRYAQHVAEHLSREKAKDVYIVLSMTLK